MNSLVVLSGKGGVGKSTVSASLAVVLSKRVRVTCADCDVDAPNLALVLGAEETKSMPVSSKQKAKFDHEACTSCKRCVQSCYFNAIGWEGKPRLKKFSCEGCGVCQLVCPSDAVSMVDIENASIYSYKTRYGFDVWSAQLKPGESGSGKVVSMVKKSAGTDSELLLIDSAAGVGCPVIASVAGSNFAVIVTEPTPSGYYDMQRAIELVEHFSIPYGIFINKCDINDIFEKRFSELPVIGRLPYDKAAALSLVKLIPLVEYERKYLPLFEELAKNMKKKL